MTDWKKRQASQKEHVHVLSLQHLSQLSTRSIFCRLDPIAIHCSFNFPPTFACLLIAVFSFFVHFFRFFELVHGHFHGLGLFIPKIITPRKMLAWWLINWVASSSHLYNPAKVVSVDCITLQGCQSRGKPFTFGDLVFFNYFLKKLKDHTSTNILTQKSSFEENYRSEGIL